LKTERFRCLLDYTAKALSPSTSVSIPPRYDPRVPPGVEIRAVTKRFGDRSQETTAVDGVSLEYCTPERIVRATHRVSFDVAAWLS